MARKGVFFNGKWITIPGAYSSVSSSMTSSRTGANANVIALIGECTGGEPGVVQQFDEPSTAQRVLKSGELLTAAQKAWNPVSRTKVGVEIGGANRILMIRSNRATRGTTDINQSVTTPSAIGNVAPSIGALTTGSLAASGAYIGTTNITIQVVITSAGVQPETSATYNWRLATETSWREASDVAMTTALTPLIDGVDITFDAGDYSQNDMFLIPVTAAVTVTEQVFTIQSRDWGIDANAISHKIETGTKPSTKKMSLYDSKQDYWEIFDNLGAAFEITYTGSQPYATMSIISNGSGKAIRLQTYVGANAATAIVDLDLELSTRTYRSLRALVQALGAFVDYKVNIIEDFNPELTVNDLDFMDKVNIIDTSGTTPIQVTALLPDIQRTLDFQSQLAVVTVINREVSNFSDYTLTPLTGGSEGTSPNSWVNFFELLSAFNITYIVPLTDDMGIIAECLEHVTVMSDNMGKERRMICGRRNNQAIQSLLVDARRLNHERCQLVSMGMFDLNQAGEVELMPPYILAAQHAGRVAFLPDGEAATHDVYRMVAPEREFGTDQIVQMLNAGVLCWEMVIPDDIMQSASVRLVQDLTTHTETTDPLRTERAIGVTADNLNKEIRREMDDMLVGKRTVTATLTSARNRILSILKQRITDEIIVAYRNVKVYKENGAVWVEYAVAPAEPTNFVLILSHFYSEDLMAAGDSSSLSGSFSGAESGII